MRHKRELTKLVRKYLKGECSREEMALLWSWIWQLDLSKEEPAMSSEEEKLLSNNLHNKIMAHISKKAGRVVKIIHYKKIIRNAAAVAAGLVVVTAGILWAAKNITEKRANESVTIFATSGHMKKVLLADSTEVVLNSGSSLRYFPKKYGETERKVLLEGEGYFKVHKDAAHPFIVQTATLVTQAIGTEFDVEAYKDENNIRVSLTHGKVSVSSLAAAGQTVILYPGQMVSYKKDAGLINAPQATAVNDVAAWINGGIVFNNIPLDEALRKLQNHFGLTIRFNNSEVKNRYVTAVFGINTGWQNILSSILFANNLQYSSKANSVIIKR